MNHLKEIDILKPINVRNFSSEIMNWIKYRADLYLKRKNPSEITNQTKKEENRLRERLQIGNDIRLVADNQEDYARILEELMMNAEKKDSP